jgi:hypothetical protein
MRPGGGSYGVVGTLLGVGEGALEEREVDGLHGTDEGGIEVEERVEERLRGEVVQHEVDHGALQLDVLDPRHLAVGVEKVV